MIRRTFLPALASLSTLAVAVACTTQTDNGPQGPDSDGNNIADDLGTTTDVDRDGAADQIDLNQDGTVDGFGVDTNGDGQPDAVALDTDCDGIFDAIDTNGDGVADFISSLLVASGMLTDCHAVAATGGTTGSGGATATGGTDPGTGGTGGTDPDVPPQLGMAQYQGAGNTAAQYAEGDIYRNGVGYKFIANGWGTGWQSHQISWNGTSFIVQSLNGTQGSDFSPAGYPTMFCGQYSDPPKRSAGSCGLPAPISSLTQVNTGWRWNANGNSGEYNAAWDIWLGNGGSLSAYLMVWLRDPLRQQPAGRAATAGATVNGLPGSWSIWTGDVNGHPIVNYVRPEGDDWSELEFDVMKVYNDAISRGYNLPGSEILSVAIGFEVWNGPVTNLETEDFYVDVK